MEMTSEARIPAPRARVWAALNDPAVLRAAIPGCQDLEQLSETELRATVVAKLGPIKARFSGRVALTNIVAPVSYEITGEGEGGIAGFAKGGASVSLEELAASETLLRYAVRAQVGGKIAQLGSRLIDTTAKKLAAEFFANFARIVQGLEEQAA